jgi:hypothetical protein
MRRYRTTDPTAPAMPMRHHTTSHHITSHHITSHHITSHHITSHHITSHHITHHDTNKQTNANELELAASERQRQQHRHNTAQHSRQQAAAHRIKHNEFSVPPVRVESHQHIRPLHCKLMAQRPFTAQTLHVIRVQINPTFEITYKEKTHTTTQHISTSAHQISIIIHVFK